MNDLEHPTPNEPDAPLPSSPLSHADAVELAHYISALSRADLPMADGARAIAGDLPPGQLAGTLRCMSEALENGQSLEDALGQTLPPHVRELIVAGADSGRLAETLDALLVHERSMDDLGQQLWQAVSYPCTLFAFLLVWLLFIALWLVPQMDTSFLLADMEELSGYGQYWNNLKEPRESPYAARLAEFARVLPPMILIVGCCLVVALVAVRLFGGRAHLSRLMTCVPLIGPAWRYRGLTEFAGLSSLFLQRSRPLADALRLTASASRDAAMREVATFAAEQADAGRPLSQSLAQRFSIPKTMVNLVAWGESNNALAESLGNARRMMAERFELQLRLIRLVVPPIVFILAAGSAVFVAYGWIGALSHAVRLLTDLS
jgi:type II secretory pathway component PulF